MKPDKNTFDELIRQRINDLPPAAPRGWEGLERRLEASPDPTDTALAAKLATLAPTVPAGSWDALSNKLTQLEAANDAAVDEAVTTGLNQSSPAQASGWPLLAARLELIGKRREMVACMKISEAALLLSLVLIFFRFGNLPQELRRPQAQLQDTGAFPITAAAPTDSEAKTAQDSAPVVSDEQQPTTEPYSVRTKGLRPLSSELVPFTSAPKLPALHAVRSSNIADQLPTLAFTPDPVDDQLLPTLPLPTAKAAEPITYVLDLFVSPVDLNQVITQENQSLGIHAGSDLTTGHSFGTLMDISQGKNALQIGFVYGYRAYVPAEILRLERKQPAGGEEDPVRYGRLRYHTVSVPLNYERELIRGEKWRLSGGLGMSMNIILSSKFRLDGIFTTEDLERQIIQYRLMLQDEGIIPAPGRASSSHEILHPEPGYLQGGGLLDNSSLYVSGNVSVERLLTDRWSLYFSPTVSRLLTVRPGDGGKGPLEDRIHNTMLRLGTRIRLTDK